jgi:predicted acyl esterase
MPLVRYPGFNPHSEVLPKGHKRKWYNKALPCNILLEKDFTLPMRDGVKLYCDIFRPSRPGTNSSQPIPEEDKVPVVLVYAPYGKEGNSELFMNELPERLGVPKDYYSGYENFEGPDPAYW